MSSNWKQSMALQGLMKKSIKHYWGDRVCLSLLPQDCSSLFLLWSGSPTTPSTRTATPRSSRSTATTASASSPREWFRYPSSVVAARLVAIVAVSLSLCLLALVHHFFSSSTFYRIPDAGLLNSQVHTDWLHDWSLAAKWARILITYLDAANPIHQIFKHDEGWAGWSNCE